MVTATEPVMSLLSTLNLFSTLPLSAVILVTDSDPPPPHSPPAHHIQWPGLSSSEVYSSPQPDVQPLSLSLYHQDQPRWQDDILAGSLPCKPQKHPNVLSGHFTVCISAFVDVKPLDIYREI